MAPLFRVLDIFDGLSGGVVADSSTPGYLLSAFQAEQSARGLSVAVFESVGKSPFLVFFELFAFFAVRRPLVVSPDSGVPALPPSLRSFGAASQALGK